MLSYSVFQPLRSMSPGSNAAAEAQAREVLVATSRDAWKNRLIDLSRRNNLLFYRPLVNGTLELPASPVLTQFLSRGGFVPISDLLSTADFAASNVRVIARKGLENLEEKGLSTLYLAVGRCSWTAEDGGRDPFAPVLLIPVTLKFKGHDLKSAEIEITGDPEINPVLLHVLEEELNVSVTAEELLGEFRADLEDRAIETATDQDASHRPEVNLQAVLDLLAARAKKVAGFSAVPFAVVGNFAFQKLAMVKDLELRGTELAGNDIVAAIAGDAAARRKLSTSHVDIDPKGLDSVPPANEFAVMEADSSQQCAISGIVAGQSAVVHGPPGTGKSQTITNLIATLAATGKKVLFVAEKRAALEVVMNRLSSAGLAHLAIDLHGADLGPKKVMETVARTLNSVRDAALPSADEVHNRFVDRRARLNQHDERMHKPHAPTGLSIYQMQGLLLRLPCDVTSPIRWRGADLASITPEKAKQIRDLLSEAMGFERLIDRTDPSPWCGIELRDAQAAQNALDVVSRLAHNEIPELLSSLERISADSKLRMPRTLTEAAIEMERLEESNRLLSHYQQDIFTEARALAESLAPGFAGGIGGVWFRLTNGGYKQAFKRALHLRKVGKASGKQVWEELKGAARSDGFWREWSGNIGRPVTVQIESAIRQYEHVKKSVSEADRLLNLSSLDIPIQDLFERAQQLASDITAPYRVGHVCEIERRLYALGVQRLVDDIRQSRRSANQWIPLFDHVWLTSTLDMVALNDPGVRAFVGSTHNGYVEDFKKLDASRLDLAAARVRRAHAEHAIAAMNKFPEQESIIRSEASKSRRHKPLRKVFAEAGDVLTAVCPCWMASPLSVCQLIGATGIFDYVVFDEASQILPEDAVPSILRGKHVIVAGDNKQLPPTTFFAAADEEDDSEVDATGYESLLDMMIPFVKGFHLNWHYRSRDESLIAFSNHHIYDDRLVTFPGPRMAGNAISHVYVNYVPSSDGQEESSAGEVQKVVELVLEHARNSPHLSLGVITMGIKHANRIQAALDRELNGSSEFSEFFDTGRQERFFIKNLERVQGDERDVIIMSVGYGKDRAGNLPLRFGPILSAGGRRRLNVAATRAKQKVIVVSSFLYSDINSSQVRPGTGLEFLKSYIEYASSGGRLLLNGELTTEPMNEFEMDVMEALASRGITLVPQLGCSKFRIDFAACHPAAPGKYVLAIECDGASYHSSYTARDRDRLRQQQLEKLGWTFHRIWSTDWFLRRNEEIDRAVHAFERAVARSDGNGKTHLDPDVSRPIRGAAELSPNAATRPSPNPPIPIRHSIDEYTAGELRNLLQWVKSDGRLRTNDELADEMFEALPFARRGSKIDAAIRKAIARG